MILNPSCLPFAHGTVLSGIPQTFEDLDFGDANLSPGFQHGMRERVAREKRNHWWKRGHHVFLGSCGVAGGRRKMNGKVFSKFHRHSQCWEEGEKLMETLPGLALQQKWGIIC